MKIKVNIHFICVLLAASLWGISGLFVRAVQKSDVGEMQIVLFRAVFSALVIGTIILFEDKKLFKIKLRDIWIFICSGVFSIVLFNYSYYNTMALTSLSVAAVLLYTAPFFVVIISLFLFKERMTVNKIGALLIAFLGCCMVSGVFDSAHRISGKALFFGLLTGFGYALYTVFGELAIKRGYHTLTITFYVFLSAFIGTLPFVNLKETAYAISDSPSVLGIIFLMAVFNTVMPYLLYTTGLKGVEPSVAPIIATVEPVVATAVGAIFFKEALTFWGVVGIVLVLVSVVILNFRKKEIRMRAYAKINIGLDIKGRRGDGYHTIDTVMQSVSIYDTVTVAKAKKITVLSGNESINGEKNIAFKAAELFFCETGIKGGARIEIVKNIPMSAGLGGGSADAAATLLALDKIYKTGLSDEELSKLALKLGADVPFFIKGGTARCEGIGEVLTPLKPLKCGYFLLIKQSVKKSTGEMYKRLDSEEYSHPDIKAIINAVNENNLEKLSGVIDNSFIAVNEELAFKERLIKMGALGVSLSGSGPVWYGFFDDSESARSAFEILKAEKIECYLAEPTETSVVFE